MKVIGLAPRCGIALLTLALAACGGASSDPKAPAAQDVTVTLTPESVTLAPGAQQAFSVAVNGTIEQSVTWSVLEGAEGGDVTADGVYTAPAIAGTYHVTATSVVDPTKSISATVTVTETLPAVTVAVSPKAASLQVSRTQTFTCTVTGSSDTGCTWSATGGTITSAGLYTAPATAGTYLVTARSSADNSKTDTATVTVTTAPPQVAVAVSPKTASVQVGGTQTFACTVTGSSNTACTWSATGGSITSGGRYTAPATAGTYVVTARSSADTSKTDTATVTVTAAPPPVAVTVSPKTASIVASGTQTFACTVTGSTNTACTWSATGGSVTAAGVYTAPATAGTYQVTARSSADTTKTDTATVTVTAAPVVAISVSPKTASLVAGGTRSFACTVTGSSNTGCTWSASGGSITAGGVFTAPATAGTYQVTARSSADTTKTDTATVTVTAAPVVNVSVSPTTASVDACQSRTFACTVTGSSTTGCTWAVQEAAGGTVTSAGVYTAPDTAGTYHVVARSNADNTKTATATVTVAERIVSVTVSPATVSLSPSGTQQFTATVTTTCGAFTQTASVGSNGALVAN